MMQLFKLERVSGGRHLVFGGNGEEGFYNGT